MVDSRLAPPSSQSQAPQPGADIRPKPDLQPKPPDEACYTFWQDELSEYVIEHAKLHEEIEAAILDMQKETDQLYQDWKEKLDYMGSSAVQPLSFDTKNKKDPVPQCADLGQILPLSSVTGLAGRLQGGARGTRGTPAEPCGGAAGHAL